LIQVQDKSLKQLAILVKLVCKYQLKLNEQQKIQDEKDEYFFNTQAAKYGAEYTDIVTTTKQKLVTGEYDENTAKAYLRQQSDN
jgi:hypothetical protein